MLAPFSFISTISWRRLPRPRKSASRIMQTYSQGEKRAALTTATPAATRSTKPSAIVSTSTMTMFLSQNEYAIISSR